MLPLMLNFFCVQETEHNAANAKVAKQKIFRNVFFIYTLFDNV